MIYITGDTHGDFKRFSKKSLIKDGLEFNEDDYIIVCGDFGMCWAEDSRFDYDCRFFAEKPYTILWVQGNHENYDMIASFKLEEWNGGKVRHIVRDKVILLERGQVFDIDGYKFFTFGGAASHDIQGGVFDRKDPDFKQKVQLAKLKGLPYRILGESWWPEELPSYEEMEEGVRNLEKVGYKVDFVITHCASTTIQNIITKWPTTYTTDRLTDYFDMLEKKLSYKRWYFGHYHDDMKIGDRHMLLYYGIVKVEDEMMDFNDVHIPGRPQYKKGERIIFEYEGEFLKGFVEIIHAYGTIDQNEEPSYDIYSDETGSLYRYVKESDINKI